MIPAMSNRREKSAITGSEPSRFSNTSTTAICARGRIGTRRGCFEIPIRGKLDDHASVTHVAQTHVRKTGLALSWLVDSHVDPASVGHQQAWGHQLHDWLHKTTWARLPTCAAWALISSDVVHVSSTSPGDPLRRYQ